MWSNIDRKGVLIERPFWDSVLRLFQGTDAGPVMP